MRRTSGPWTPTIHALLGYLADAGFTAAPRPFGIDDEGREVLEYIEGESSDAPPYPARVTSDDALVDAARLLARVHDLSLGFSPPTDAIWGESAPDPGPIEVIAHRDWTPYNAVFRDGRLVAVVDWDLARPGSRLADLAWAAFMWVPLVPDQAALDSGWALPLDRVARLRRFCDAYGLAERARIVDAVDTRIAGHLRWVSEQAEAGHRAYAAMVADGALDFYRTCLDYLRAEAESWRLALEHDE